MHLNSTACPRRMARCGSLMVAALLPAFLGVQSGAAEAGAIPAKALQALLDKKVKASAEVPGAVLAVARGKATWIGAAGIADRSKGTPMAPGQRLRVGSLTKHFTAALILKLAEEGALTLDDKVDRWLPALHVPNGDRITIRMLLNHTSGLPSYTTSTFWEKLAFPDPYRAWTPRELVELARAGTVAEPGTAYSYSNTGYAVAGLIAEAASGESASAAMQRRFFSPLGMADTTLAVNGTIAGSCAHGYLKRPSGTTVEDVTDWDPSAAWTAGALVTSARDLMRWQQALFHGKVISRASLTQMLTPVAPAANYGLGLGTAKMKDGREIIFHSGQICGYSATVGYHAASDTVLVVLTNREDIWQASNDVVNPLFGDALDLLK